MLEIIGTIVGLLYLWLEYRANIYVWATGVIMPAIYIFVYYDAGLYADFAINIYYLLAAAYGVVMWRRGSRGARSLPVTHTPRAIYPLLAAVALILFLAIGIVLKECTDSTVPWCDSFTTALSIVAMYMLAHKHVEQWLVWIVVDVVSCALYLYKDLYATSLLYALYVVIAVFGYMRWRRMAVELR